MPYGVRTNFTVDLTGFNQALSRYLGHVQPDKLVPVFEQQLKLMMREVIDVTPFESLAQGRSIVKRDLYAAMKPYGGEDGSFSGINSLALRARLAGYMAKKDYDSIKQVFSKVGKKSGFQLVDFDVNRHYQNMNADGHPRDDLMVWVLQVDQWKQYLEHLRGQVGRARGGWANAARHFGLSLPAWVTRWAGGGYIELNISGAILTYTMVNRGAFFRNAHYKDKIEYALAQREKYMEADLRRYLAGAASNAGFQSRSSGSNS